ncbi:hypothetical protein D9F61_10045 [Escherichia coli]|uniref:hypothetical protein n=1 Tax=Escherichia coli TaxID=562 RepID=UPI000FC330E0|nr:hypothetical protein [Escherichia coli]MDU4241207.1 hypothetical protein [Bifidobacterium longum]EFU6042335.1 hypothetical protein [Escherichia coli]EHS4345479.1 hypothetical protein [Escherichia coli]EIM4699306.1 hypothetical protein [Escherichia coli]
MKRENRYFVLKVSDIEAAFQTGLISPETLDGLENAALAVKQVRQQRGKDELSCVVVESDWPEHEVVWGMIEARVEGMQS